VLLLDIVTTDDIMNNLIQKEEELQEEEQAIEGIPICGANLSTPVTETAQYIKEIHYKIGNRLYIENAD
jgi:hypothetical protein